MLSGPGAFLGRVFLMSLIISRGFVSSMLSRSKLMFDMFLLVASTSFSVSSSPSFFVKWCICSKLYASALAFFSSEKATPCRLCSVGVLLSSLLVNDLAVFQIVLSLPFKFSIFSSRLSLLNSRILFVIVFVSRFFCFYIVLV